MVDKPLICSFIYSEFVGFHCFFPPCIIQSSSWLLSVLIHLPLCFDLYVIDLSMINAKLCCDFGTVLFSARQQITSWFSPNVKQHVSFPICLLSKDPLSIFSVLIGTMTMCGIEGFWYRESRYRESLLEHHVYGI